MSILFFKLILWKNHVTGETVDEVAEKVKMEVAEMISSLISLT
jgi:hypothetical protein